jgi:hypothetical protein
MAPIPQSVESLYLRVFSDLGHVASTAEGTQVPPEGMRRDRIVILESVRIRPRVVHPPGRGAVGQAVVRWVRP